MFPPAKFPKPIPSRNKPSDHPVYINTSRLKARDTAERVYLREPRAHICHRARGPLGPPDNHRRSAQFPRIPSKRAAIFEPRRREIFSQPRRGVHARARVCACVRRSALMAPCMQGGKQFPLCLRAGLSCAGRQREEGQVYRWKR